MPRGLQYLFFFILKRDFYQVGSTEQENNPSKAVETYIRINQINGNGRKNTPSSIGPLFQKVIYGDAARNREQGRDLFVRILDDISINLNTLKGNFAED